jgi:GTP-binding protein
MFVDELQISVRAGKGGDGCVSFLRDKNVQRGGPDGGDGGDGGSVILQPSTHVNTLYHLTGQGLFAAKNGDPGGSKDCYGKKAGDLVLEVPVGTMVVDIEHGNVLKDLIDPSEPFIIARGGFGGRGNARFATSTHRSPREAERGTQGEQRDVLLSLKLIADVGLLGLPNAGKSTLLATLTRARPKIAGYPFTTLEPMLGIAEGPGGGTFVIADIPGLIEGAHLGKGLGDKFLKHIERTRLLLHLVDCSELALQPPADAYRTVRNELAAHSEALASRPSIVVATKVEDEASEQCARELEEALGHDVLRISSAMQKGLRDLVIEVVRALPPRED